MLLLQITQAVTDSLQVAADNLDQAIANADGLDKISLITQQLIDAGVRAGGSILKAVLVFIVGRFLVSMLNKLAARMMDKRHVDVSIKTFVKSLDDTFDYFSRWCIGCGNDLVCSVTGLCRCGYWYGIIR